MVIFSDHVRSPQIMNIDLKINIAFILNIMILCYLKKYLLDVFIYVIFDVTK